MRLERITLNKFKVSLSSDDLFDRGICNDDILKESNKWHQLFHEMLDEACGEFGVDIQGQVIVEVFSLQTQGMIMIITLEEDETVDEEDFRSDSFVEMQITVGGREDLLFEFDDFEHIIQLSKYLRALNVTDGKIYMKDNKYYLYFDTIYKDIFDRIACILSEFGNPSLVSYYMLEEYGTVIMENKAIEKIVQYFK